MEEWYVSVLNHFSHPINLARDPIIFVLKAIFLLIIFVLEVIFLVTP
jgi:hypothetical protein